MELLKSKQQVKQKCCINCGESFVARRRTRKYCSDNCKQIHFYKRNGLLQSGIPIQEQISFNVKDALKVETDTNPDSLSLNDNHFTLNGNNLQEVFDHIQAYIDKRLEQTVEKVIKNVRQTVEDSDFTVSYKTVSTPETEEIRALENEEESVFQLKFIDLHEDEFTLNGKEQEAGKTKKDQGRNSDCNLEQDKDYEYFSSALLNKVHFYEEKAEIMFMFSRPQNYWNNESIQNVSWVSQRLSTLIGTLLHLDKQAKIDNIAICSVAESFYKMCGTRFFLSLPINYPFTELIIELRQKMISLAEEHLHSSRIRFRLSPERKAQLIATRWQMGDFVPRVKFNQTNFKEE